MDTAKEVVGSRVLGGVGECLGRRADSSTELKARLEALARANPNIDVRALEEMVCLENDGWD